MPGILHLIRWVNYPQKPLELPDILKACSDDELLTAAQHVRGSAGRIAWAELARRWEYFDFQIGVSKGVGRLDVVFEALARPIHDVPNYS